MKTKLLLLALAERNAHGFMTDYTRYLLNREGVTSVQIEQFFELAGV